MADEFNELLIQCTLVTRYILPVAKSGGEMFKNIINGYEEEDSKTLRIKRKSDKKEKK